MTELTKNMILEANENIKNAAKLFQILMKEIEFHPDLIANANMAFSEIVKCIKHMALVQGEITGKELMGPDFNLMETPKETASAESDPALN